MKKELPEATQRFVKIDADVKSILAGFKQTQNCVQSCGKDGLLKFLEKQQSELEVCALLPQLNAAIRLHMVSLSLQCSTQQSV